MIPLNGIYRYINERIDEEFRRRGFVGTTLRAGHVGGVLPPGQVAMSHDDLTDVSPDDHHAQAHAGTGPDHTYSGLTTGHILTATGPGSAAFQPNTGGGVTSHDALTDVSADDHHAQVHTLTGANHSVSGLTAGHALRATGATTYAFGAVQHADLGGVSADQHHAQAHSGTGADHTYSGLTAGHVLTASSATAAGFAAVTAPAMVKIAESVLASSAASVQFASIPGTYRHLLLVCTARGDAAVAATTLNFRMNGAVSAIYDFQEMFSNGSTVAAGGQSGVTAMTAGVVAGSTAPGGEYGWSELLLPNYTNTSHSKGAVGQHARKHAHSVGNLYIASLYATCRSTAAITQIDLFPGSGNFVAGSSFALYGIS